MNEMGRHRMVWGLVYTWESQACQYAPKGEPGIGYELHHANEYDAPPGAPVDCLLMRDRRGDLVGILNHYPTTSDLEEAGNVNIWVRPDRQKRGIASRLVREAQSRWEINFLQQRYSPAGLKLLASLHRKEAE